MAFLVGIARFEPAALVVRQYVVTGFSAEPAMLAAAREWVDAAECLVTFNGKSFDWPLLETRYRMSRFQPPFDRLPHLDLLFGARRLWKLRFDSCRLVDLENQILGLEREGDLPGELIPYVYFEYLRTGEAFKLVPILNASPVRRYSKYT